MLVCLTAADLEAIAKDCGPAHAEIIATRSVPAAPEQPDVRLPDQPLSRTHRGSELAGLFYAAGAVERRLILINLEYAGSAAPPPAPRWSARISGGWNRLRSSIIWRQ